MSSITDMISELVRAANGAGKLGKHERLDLLVRAVTAIRDMAETVDGTVAQAAAKEIVELQVQVAIIGARANTPEEVRDALLLTAGMIRDQHISLDTGRRRKLRGRTVE